MLVPKELIIEAKEKLGDKAAFIIAEDLKLDEFDTKNLKARCPFHKEDSASFIFNPKENSYKCFGCGKVYGIIDHYMSYNGLTFLSAVEKLFEQSKISFRFGEKGVKTDRDYKYPKYDKIESRFNVESYLALRGISKETLDYCDVQEDAHKNVVLNFYDTNDVLTLVKYRPARKILSGETKTWCQQGADTKNLLYNMNRIDPTKPLILVEGELDCLSVIESGIKNVVSIPLGAQNSKWLSENFDWIDQFEKIVVWFDNDAPGINARKEACARLGTWKTYFIDLPKEIEKNGTPVLVKDANEVLYRFGKQKVLDIIDSAQEVPIANIVDLYDVGEFDIETAQGIYSSSKELGTYIYKYLLGTVLILTGRNGNGKSVFLNQEFVAEPLNQGRNIFMYSAEMGRPILKSWIELVLAGRNNVKLVNETIHKIDGVAKKDIREWYKDRIFVYDNDKDLSADSILDRLETVVRRNGVQVAILDNLLTIDLPIPQGSDIWQEQKKFMVRLVNFASKYNIFIVLVAHPKKTAEFRRLTSDDIGGPGALANLAHYVLSIHRYTKKEKDGEKDQRGKYRAGKEPQKYDCVIDLFKNRITGHANKEINQFFDYLSYRFYSTPAELWKRYKWEKNDSPIPTNDPNIHETVPDWAQE
jgi:archaellum biogenesis ATPase FlaH/5S rRNA maturation endonuclease (ribonuclease M5)